GIKLNQSIINPRGIDLTLAYVILPNSLCTCEYHKLRMQLSQFSHLSGYLG
ncbi:hypothetical protein GBA52_014783, partial [Prunus armeniaca]